VCRMWSLLMLWPMLAVTCVRAEELVGDNICYTEVLESIMVNTTYLESVKIKKHFACLRLPPVCAEWVNKMETRWREENITRPVSKSDCCPGYRKKGQGRGRQKICAPWCGEGCVNGRCSAPETCSCSSGFSGERCEIPGCPGGRWGPGCESECECEHGGHCSPTNGQCTCTPGYSGDLCEEMCEPGTYGMDCQSSCSCPTGHNCHPVTGDCTPCTRGTWGDNCVEKCRCDDEGTELCSHKDGRCFCKGNRFGLRCELDCPFGFINNTCLTQPMSGVCQCPNDLYTCDLTLGCICPHGTDCGLEIIDRTVKLAPLSSETQSSSSSATTIILAVLIIALVVVFLVVIYYRRRMKMMKRDLAIRSEPSVYYSDPDRERDIDLEDRHETGPSSSGLVLNNVRLTLDSQARLQPSTSNSVPGMVKNINVDNFKLGMPSHPLPPPSSCMDRMMEEAQEEVEDEPLTELQAQDVNLFLENLEKGKVRKADIEKMIKNNLKQDNIVRSEGATFTSTEEDPFADFETKLNVVMPDKNDV